ncbi:hypothetical protein [Oceanomicrobium pacificus]|uniref:Uncharacterized protein n=1 Tax=Oceanomicrobium pacificus TaxID=2692916 RepID=A0A6B0TZ58_9RHOB|nr:hypothetical protein [Oceanomicrobium pacificus]MXU66303.1 hypothetical protein [Oceanomicrobium pacificus]
MRIVLIAAVAMGLTACAEQMQNRQVVLDPSRAAPAPTQLEASLGLRPEEWGQYSLQQLNQIKFIQDNPSLSQSQKRQRIAHAKRYEPIGITF